MTPDSIPNALRQLVRTRASERCEYCGLPEEFSFYVHEVDHIIARKHGGVTDARNLALSCWRCNRHKGADIATFDPADGALTMLYHPRTATWTEHFSLQDGQIMGHTAAGRGTAVLLQFNTDERVIERRQHVAAGIRFFDDS
jgi:hypothetical protein